MPCIKTVVNNALNCRHVLIDCEQIQQPIWTQFSHWQMFVQNGESTAFWYLQHLYYLTQLQFTIIQTSLCGLGVFSETTAELGWPEHSASFMPVRPCLKSAYYLLTVVSDGAEPEWHLSSHCVVWTIFFTIKKEYFINTRNSDFSIVLKISNSSFT